MCVQYKRILWLIRECIMICKLVEPTINKDNPFENCKLDRQRYAQILTKVICQKNGCVFSIDGEWGSGKTTFVRMWKQSLMNEGFNVLYFNVWEHDFISDPIIGMVSQFRAMNGIEKAKASFAGFTAAAGKVASGIIPSLVKGLVKKYVSEDAVEVIESAAESISHSFDKIIDEYVEQCQSMEEFRKALENLVESSTQEGKPLVFIIDELDRCNPHFAVKVLERIKHLFNVPNIVFVLSIDKQQLLHSICGYYGSERLNAEEYLKRFIDIEYRLPDPDVDKFTNYLYDIYEFDSFFASEARKNYFQRDKEKEEFLRMAKIIFENMHLNLRQMEKIFGHIRLALQTFGENQQVSPDTFLMIMYFRANESDFYRQIKNKELTAQEMLSQIENVLPNSIFIENENNKYTAVRYAVWGVAQLMVSYCLDMSGRQSEPLLKKINTNNTAKDTFKLLITPRIIPVSEFQRAIEWYDNHIFGNEKVVPLCYQIQHIELLSPVHD